MATGSSIFGALSALKSVATAAYGWVQRAAAAVRHTLNFLAATIARALPPGAAAVVTQAREQHAEPTRHIAPGVATIGADLQAAIAPDALPPHHADLTFERELQRLLQRRH